MIPNDAASAMLAARAIPITSVDLRSMLNLLCMLTVRSPTVTEKRERLFGEMTKYTEPNGKKLRLR
jgi:hypothetical protein